MNKLRLRVLSLCVHAIFSNYLIIYLTTIWLSLEDGASKVINQFIQDIC